MRAHVEECSLRDGKRALIAVFEASALSQIHRQDITVRQDASDAEVLLAIAAAWNQMAADALSKRALK